MQKKFKHTLNEILGSLRINKKKLYSYCNKSKNTNRVKKINFYRVFIKAIKTKI